MIKNFTGAPISRGLLDPLLDPLVMIVVHVYTECPVVDCLPDDAGRYETHTERLKKVELKKRCTKPMEEGLKQQG